MNGVFAVVNKATAKVICDAGPIIHLDELESVHLLSDFREVLVGPHVRAEIAQFRPLALAKIDQFSSSPVVASSQDPVLLSLCKVFALDAGEVEALLLMKQFPANMLLTDDAAARVVAERMGFRVHGSIGILIRAIRRGQLKAHHVLELLDQVPDRSTLFIRRSLLDHIKESIRKEYGL